MNQTQQCLRPSSRTSNGNGKSMPYLWRMPHFTRENLQQMFHLRWVSRVPGTLTAAKTLLENMPEEAFNDSVISGYRIAPCCSEYGGVRQRWLVVESQARKDADLKQLEKRLTKHLSKPNPNFGCCLNKNLLAQKML